MLLRTYETLPITIERGEDVYVFDVEGKKYLDLYSGHAVCSTGHCHPAVVRAVQEQAAKLLFYSNVVPLAVREEAAAALVRHAPGYRVLFSSSGAEAVEDALKLARRVTGRDGIVAMHRGFHGRTAGAMSVTGFGRMRVGPQVPGTTFEEFGRAPILREDTAAVLLEPIQSMAGVRTAPPEYFRSLRDQCDRAGALLIFDEVQTGIGRTGTMFFSGREGVHADLVVLAKGMGSGIPIGAVLVREAIAEKVAIGDFGHTFGGGPIAMAALRATLEVVEGLLPNVRETGAYLADRLGKFGEVRGTGFLLGLRISGSARLLRDELLRRGVIVGTSSEPDVVRILPPLTLTRDHVESFLGTLDAAFHQYAGTFA